MGFGIALIGYAFLLLNIAGGALFAAPLLAYGFFSASRLERNFLNASVSALFMLPHGVLQVASLAFGFDGYPRAISAILLSKFGAKPKISPVSASLKIPKLKVCL